MTSLWVLGLAGLGAALFTAAGVALARFLATTAEPPALPVAPPPVGPPPELLSALEEKGLALEAAQREGERLVAELATCRRRVDELERAREAGATDLGDARAEHHRAQERVAALERAAQDLTTKLATAERQLSEARAAAAARPGPGPSFSELELSRTRTALEQACDEIATLRLERQRAERAELAKLALERELQFLRSTQTAASTSSLPLKSVSMQVPSLTNAHLTELVERVRQEGQYLAVTVADHQGLPAAGVGERVDELAAFTSLVLTLGQQAERYFPMHEFGHATLSDGNGVTVEARPVPGPHGLVLMTLGASQERR